MSLFDYFARDPWFEFQKMPSIFDQDFGRAMRLSDLVKPMFDRLRSMYFRPWRHLLSSHDDDSDFLVDEDGFKVVLDVVQFSPSEITVKVVGNTVVVEGKHEEKRDEHGYVSRHFIRRYTVPSGVHMDDVTSALSSDGVLTVSAPKVQALKDRNVRVIPITMTATPAMKTAEKVHEISKTNTESHAVKNTQVVHEIPITKTSGSTSVKRSEKVLEIPIVRKESTRVRSTEEVHEAPIVRKEYTLLKNSEKVHEIPVIRRESTVVRNTEKVHEIPIARKESTVFKNTEKVHEIPITRKESTVVNNTEKVHEIPITRKESTVFKNTEKVHEIPITRKESTVVKNTERFHEIPNTRKESTVVSNSEKFHEIQVIRKGSSGFKNVEKIRGIPMLRGESTDINKEEDNKEQGRVHEIPITRSESVCTVRTENEADEKIHDIPIALIESPAPSIFDGERILDASISRTESTDFNITEVTSEKGDDD